MCVPGPPAIADRRYPAAGRAFRPRAEPHRPRVAGGCALYDPGRVAPFLYRRRNRDVSGRKRMAPVRVTYTLGTLHPTLPRGAEMEGQPLVESHSAVNLDSAPETCAARTRLREPYVRGPRA